MKSMKGANIIIAMGILAIFIAAFFIIFVFDKLISVNMACIIYSGSACTGEGLATSTLGLFIVFALIIMIAAAVYIMFISLESERLYRYRKPDGGKRGE